MYQQNDEFLKIECADSFIQTDGLAFFDSAVYTEQENI